MSGWWQRTAMNARFAIVLMRLRWINFLVRIMPLLPLNKASVGWYTAWIDGQLTRAFAFLKSPLPTFEETRKAMDEAYSNRGTPLRWIHPMPVADGVITTRSEVQEGTVVAGYQGPDRHFAYLEPHAPESPNLAHP